MSIYYDVKIHIFNELRKQSCWKKSTKYWWSFLRNRLNARDCWAAWQYGSGFALIPSDAAKIISNDIYGIDLATAYFVFCSSYNFRGAVLTNQRLYEMAARGLCVAVGVRSIPREYEFICKVFYPEDFPWWHSRKTQCGVFLKVHIRYLSASGCAWVQPDAVFSSAPSPLPPTRHNNDSDKRAWKWQQTWEFPEGVYYSFFILLFKIGLP